MRNISKITIREGKVRFEDCSDLSCEGIGNGHFFDRVLHYVQTVVGYIFGIHIGYALGGAIGLFIGGLYVECSSPGRFSSWNEMSQWAFARTGAVVGVFMGIVAMRIVQSIFLSRDIAALCDKGATEAEEIANALGRRVRQIQRRMDRLARKGFIAYQATDSSEQRTLWGPKGEDMSGHLAAPTPILKSA